MQKSKAFSLIELIFMIVVMGIIASVALPKLMNTRDNAIISSLKQDVATITTSIQSYYLVKGKIDKISDAVNFNTSTWKTGSSDNEILYSEDSTTCITIKVVDSNLSIIVDGTASGVDGSICKKLLDDGVVSSSYKL